MPQAVVDGLEPVQVHHEQRDRRPVAFAQRHQRVQPSKEGAPVEQHREAVLLCFLGKQLFFDDLVGDIDGDSEDRRDRLRVGFDREASAAKPAWRAVFARDPEIRDMVIRQSVEHVVQGGSRPVFRDDVPHPLIDGNVARLAFPQHRRDCGRAQDRVLAGVVLPVHPLEGLQRKTEPGVGDLEVRLGPLDLAHIEAGAQDADH